MEIGAVIKHDIKKAPKTGDWRYMKPEVIKEKCVGCGACVKYCPEAVIETIDRKQLTIDHGKMSKVKGQILSNEVAQIDYYFCKGCGVCANVCPEKAIIMKKETECVKCGMEAERE
ncbi:MAG: hypothetical protein A3J63_02590 [Candidatus Moranbacteria bacterium RIFCSPHIGHO2_02_FULL_40_12b]|nr:MAG: hypothetical protein A3J63_02590 [Candidatus Moranbacteria bacterium RIFCSPHIGHO2_02_FULL_40_12b]OGI24069.1 MAG: hypothetical protein A3E91_00240 [Candidatus Moranbacteria bacterium RIFCSPHIGHO2_12_FULL_40_10]